MHDLPPENVHAGREWGVKAFEGGKGRGAKCACALEVHAAEGFGLFALAGAAGASVAGGAGNLVIAADLHRFISFRQCLTNALLCK